MNILEGIRKSKKNSKQLLVEIATAIKKDPKLIEQIKEGLKKGSKTEKGILMESLEYVTKDDPAIVEKLLNTITDFINYKDSPRVRWEAARIIANVSAKYPKEAGKVVDKLFLNTNDKGTVVRWSAAYALGKIARYNLNSRTNLVPKIEAFLKKEQNSGVKNVYLKALMAISK
ncbi:HEAT repeat domain-containing protein [Patescibacteria group bacterium]|nr:HEAT repeat domain-containing protein [Patescibacteria group bacterium]MCL5797966.1 HEAT repeat domain-containing protein [Patescibacteria group bacterium]